LKSAYVIHVRGGWNVTNSLRDKINGLKEVLDGGNDKPVNNDDMGFPKFARR